MMNPEPDEYGLALRAREGDSEALAELIERARLRLFALAYAELRHYENAQDAVASALLQICLHVKELREPERVWPWMFTIVRNEVRRLRRSPGASHSSLEEAQEPTEDRTPSFLRLDIERALRRLPGDQSRAIALYYLADLSVREIARQIGRPEGTIKYWLHAGRRRFATEMQEYRPMTQSEKAAIFHTDLDPSFIRLMADGLRAAGYDEVITLNSVPTIERTKQGDTEEWHLPKSLNGVELFIAYEWVGGRSALELIPLLKLCVESRDKPHCLLVSNTTKQQFHPVFAFWQSGVDCFLTLPINPSEFQEFMQRLRAQYRGEASRGSTANSPV